MLGAGGWTFGVRAAWVAALVAYALARPRPDQLDAVALALASAVAMVLIAWTGGGVATEYFRWLHALPLAALVVFPAATAAPALAGAATLVGGSLVVHAEGGGAVPIAAFAAANACSLALGVAGSLVYRRLRAAERAAEAARLRAVEELADSERRRAKVERLALLGRLAAGVAHEVNNPLACAAASVRSVREAVEDGAAPAARRAELAEALDDASAGLGRIQRIVSDLGAFAHDEEQAAGGCCPEAAVAEAVRLSAARVRRVASVDVVAPASPSPVRADPGRLSRAVQNLLLNAADALEDAGRRGRVCVRIRGEGAAVAVTVEDDGPGIPEAAAGRLFEPFFTARGIRGTGLGLAVARRLVERDGGAVEAGRSGWGGACFTLRLPAAMPGPWPGAPPPAAVPPEGTPTAAP
jgi:signal transduction histidine kinase